MLDPIFPHVQFQFHQEYELASHGKGGNYFLFIFFYFDLKILD